MGGNILSGKLNPGGFFTGDMDIRACLKIVWRRRYVIAIIAAVSAAGTAVYSLRMPDIYEATAVITPVGGGETGRGGLSLLAQQLGGAAGITPLSSASESEIVSLLKSNVLREEVIKGHNLLPVLFDERWDKERNGWRRREGGALSLQSLISGLTGVFRPAGKDAGVKSESGPTTWDGLRALAGMVNVSRNIKENIITVSVEFRDPEIAARTVEYMLSALTDHMSRESERVASTNRRYLEAQLERTADPLIRQKIYSLITRQIEMSMMSEVKENFAFKVIDPPRVPDRRIAPQRTRMVAVGLAVSLFAGVLLAFIAEFLRRGEG